MANAIEHRDATASNPYAVIQNHMDTLSGLNERQALTLAQSTLNDIGNADRFDSLFSGMFRYIPEQKQWLLWMRHHWAQLPQAMAQHAGEHVSVTMKRLLDEGKDMIKSSSDQPIDSKLVAALANPPDEVKKHVQSLGNVGRIKGMLTAYGNRHVIRESELDAEPMMIGVQNGVLEFGDEVTLRDGRKEDLITRQLPVPYDAEATCPRWTQFIEEITAGFHEDRTGRDTDARNDKAEFIQQLFGYCLFDGNPESLLLIAEGEGANGKSVCLEVLRSLLGPLAANMGVESLIPNASGKIRADIARLEGARVVTLSETNKGTRIDEALVKILTGGDRLTARMLYANPREFTLGATFILATNHAPVVDVGDPALRRRIKVIPFDVVIPPDKRDGDLLKKLTTADELMGILAWAVQGYRAYVRNQRRLDYPEAVTDATDRFFQEYDVMDRWLEILKMPTDKADWTRASDLLDFYNENQVRLKLPKIGKNTFARRLRDRDIDSEKRNDGTYYPLAVPQAEEESPPEDLVQPA